MRGRSSYRTTTIRQQGLNRWIRAIFVLSLAVVSIASDCDEPFHQKKIGTTRLGYTVMCEGGAVTPLDVQSNQIQVYQVGPGGKLVEVSHPLNGQPCPNSEGDNAVAKSMSQPVAPPAGPASVSADGHNHRSAGSSHMAMQDLFGLLAPIPGLPLFPESSPPADVPCTPGTSIYMVNHNQSTVTHLSVCPLGVLQQINVGSNPLQLALTPDGRTLVVTRYDSRVVLVDTAADAVSATINTPGLFPNGIAISPDGNTAYVTNFDNVNSQVFEIDLATRQIDRTVATPYAFPKSLALTPDGQQLWVNYYQNSAISIIDTLTMTTAAQVSVNGTADTGLAFNPTGTRAYIAARPSQLVVVDTATLQPVATVPVEQVPTNVLVSPDGSTVFVRSGLSAVVSIVDARTNTLINNASVGNPGGQGIALFW